MGAIASHSFQIVPMTSREGLSFFIRCWQTINNPNLFAIVTKTDLKHTCIGVVAKDRISSFGAEALKFESADEAVEYIKDHFGEQASIKSWRGN